MGGDPSYVVGPFAHKEDRPESLGVTLTPPLREFGLSESQFPHQPNGDASDSSAPCRAQAGGSRWQAARGSSLTWALQGGCRVESELAEMGSILPALRNPARTWGCLSPRHWGPAGVVSHLSSLLYFQNISLSPALHSTSVAATSSSPRSPGSHHPVLCICTAPTVHSPLGARFLKKHFFL